MTKAQTGITVQFLRRCPAFKDAPLSLVSHVLSNCTERQLSRNEVIAHQGDPFPYLGVVREGSVRAKLGSPDGREQLVYEAHPLETFAEIPLLDQGETLSLLCAGEEGACVALIARAALVHVCAVDKSLSLRVAEAAAQRARSMMGRLTELAFTSTTSRIARALLRCAQPGSNAKASPQFARLSQAKIAELGGTVRVVAARSLRTLADVGAIRLRKGRVVQIDEEALAKFL
ncbi:MAG: Crp/Fnr family transcriptional regulator [Candidatus Eremiobacteraeota bacterium]|nr:Crp/Fnr family transcriptional regulator [Candidatus Eremiobacteraeota bacterium]